MFMGSWGPLSPSAGLCRIRSATTPSRRRSKWPLEFRTTPWDTTRQQLSQEPYSKRQVQGHDARLGIGGLYQGSFRALYLLPLTTKQLCSMHCPVLNCSSYCRNCYGLDIVADYSKIGLSSFARDVFLRKSAATGQV